jgi:hypothetical protein
MLDSPRFTYALTNCSHVFHIIIEPYFCRNFMDEKSIVKAKSQMYVSHMETSGIHRKRIGKGFGFGKGFGKGFDDVCSQRG